MSAEQPIPIVMLLPPILGWQAELERRQAKYFTDWEPLLHEECFRTLQLIYAIQRMFGHVIHALSHKDCPYHKEEHPLHKTKSIVLTHALLIAGENGDKAAMMMRVYLGCCHQVTEEALERKKRAKEALRTLLVWVVSTTKRLQRIVAYEKGEEQSHAQVLPSLFSQVSKSPFARLQETNEDLFTRLLLEGTSLVCVRQARIWLHDELSLPGSHGVGFRFVAVMLEHLETLLTEKE